MRSGLLILSDRELRKDLMGASGFDAVEQFFNAGAGFNEGFLFILGQFLNLLLEFQSSPLFTNLFFENQL